MEYPLEAKLIAKVRENIMNYKRILTIQDISCVGQCSLTVALPILSACGVETAILPSTVLSNHTAFPKFTVNDLTDDMPNISAQWKELGLDFEALYTGYLGSSKQIDIVKSIIRDNLKSGAKVIVDPAMADNGALYYGFDQAYVEEMNKLMADADFILPNMTEACFMTGTPYRAEYDEAFLLEIMEKLQKITKGVIIMTGASFSPEKSGVAIYHNGSIQYYTHEKREKSCHGTGDVFASAFTGALMNGFTALESSKIAADFVVDCIDETAKLDNHWYGVAFEPSLGQLAGKVVK